MITRYNNAAKQKKLKSCEGKEIEKKEKNENERGNERKDDNS